MTQTDDVRRSLEATCADLAALADPWWIIGSAAAILTGLAQVTALDIDVLTSLRDAITLRGRWSTRLSTLRPALSDRFRSTFARFDFAPLPIEVMGGLETRDSDGVWRAVRPRTRVAIPLNAAATVFTPTIAEQVEIFRRFGRPKDLERADALLRFRDSGGAPTLSDGG